MDTRPSDNEQVIRRRRECIGCGRRFTTYERVELRMPRLVKKGGSRTDFDRNKLVGSMTLALRKRPVATEDVDAAVDRILLVHALEMSDDPEGLLREVWRVLAPSGRMVAVIPNRRGVWTRTDNTPFGHGRPYSRSQITQLLRQAWFTPTAWGEALFVPPVAGGWFLRSAMAWERAGAALSLPFAGVHIVEATKQVYRAIPAHRERTRLIPALRRPVLVPSSLQR